MPSAALALCYLFGCRFSDGTEYFQSLDDVSVFDARRSAFYDLCQHAENGDSLCDENGSCLVRDDIEYFALIGEDEGRKPGAMYAVDLRDGHFEVDGRPFFVQIPPTGAQLRLTYFRRVRRHFQGGCEVGAECEYHMGWKDINSGAPPVTLILF
ncbi:hypothetical protein EPO05_06280 [Patescibacteria group bacterium]|nr:MAG: hypothetical protein EPO05_06280 [Patescibacteria group bacterium]